MKTKEIILAPRLFQTLSGVFVSILSKSENRTIAHLPEKMGDFRLEKIIPRDTIQKNLAIGVYSKGNEKFLVKRWVGKYKDMQYYSLINEYAVHLVLAPKMASFSVRLPKAISYTKDRTSISLVYEFIEGETADSLPVQRQVMVVEKTLEYFAEVSGELTKQERTIFSKRTALYFLLLMPLLTVFCIAKNSKDTKILLRTLGAFYTMHFATHDRPLMLAHRDLTPSNLMVSGGTVYILDTESVALTMQGYDVAYLFATPGQQALCNSMKNLKTPNSEFLKLYIALHHILGSGQFLTPNKDYLNLLYTFSYA